MSKFILILFSTSLLGISAYNEDPCKSEGGSCMYYWNCPQNNYVSGKCPTQSNSIRCCFAYQETACSNLGGKCQYDSGNCLGTYLSGKCPTQPAGVRCCVPQSSGSGGGSTSCPPENYVTRSQWGAKPSKNSLSYMGNNRPYVFVHHTTGSRCYTKSSCAQLVRNHQAYHLTKWSDIGYSFLIGDSGHIFEGRGYNKVGAHTYGFNSKGYGIAFIGDFTNAVPTQAAINAFNNLVSCMKTNGKISTSYKLKGHRQTKATSCPGNALYAAMQSWPNFSPGQI